MARDNRGLTLSHYVGGQGITWGSPAGQLFHQFGYPDVPPYNGQVAVRCSDSGFLYRTSDRAGQYEMVAMHCPMGLGASGGPWIVNLDARTGRGWVNGTRSGRTVDMRLGELSLSPYFSSYVGELYNMMARS